MNIILKIVLKLAAVPVLVILLFCQLITTVIMNVYSVIHGILWLIISAFVILTICFGQWQQLIAALLIGAFLLLVTTLFNAVDIFLDGICIKIRKYIFS